MKIISSILGTIAILCTSSLSAMTVEIHNPAPFPRPASIVEIPGETIRDSFGTNFIIVAKSGKEMPYQITYSGDILIEDNFTAEETKSYRIKKGKAVSGDTICVAQIRNDFQDDLTWENDRGGYRLYGPGYRNGGGNVAGYDIWTKSVTFPVLSQRYTDHCQHGISYHKDHGNGMDCYTVGHTLGAGMNAIRIGNEIIYPCAYKECEILENGPLRTSMKIICYPATLPDGQTVTEERIITLDKGSWMNKTEVRYHGLTEEIPLVTGIVIHRQNPHGYVLDKGIRYMAYADLTDNPDKGNGVIYIGIVNPYTLTQVSYEGFEVPDGDALGHIISSASIKPGAYYTYYWGSGWSKGGVKGMDDWIKILNDYSRTLDYPFTVIIK